MRILFISYHTCPLASQEGKETGGMNVYVLELAKAMGKLGHQVDMVTRTQAPGNKKEIQIAPGVRLFHLPAGPLKVLSKQEMFDFIDDFSAGLKELVQQQFLNSDHHYDVIHAHYYMSGIVACKLRSVLPQAPLVMTFHTLALMKNLVGRSEGEMEDATRIEAEQMLVQKTDAIVSPTQTEKEYLQYLYMANPSKISVISPGVNIEHFRNTDQLTAKKMLGADINHKILLFVGRIEPLKGIDSLLYAMKILKVRRPELNLCLWIVGGDVSQPVSKWSLELQRLERLRRELDLETSVKFEGQQTQERLPYYYNVAELLVMPSHYEAFGMVALEAMACGTPVITSNVTGVSTLIDQEHEEIITTANNPLLLASQIEFLLTHHDSYLHIQKSLLRKVQKLSWLNISQQIIDVYQDVVSK